MMLHLLVLVPKGSRDQLSQPTRESELASGLLACLLAVVRVRACACACVRVCVCPNHQFIP